MVAASSIAIPREALSHAVQDRITRFIIDQGYRPGDLLPAEPELARALGISRSSLREAMKVLQTLGVVETVHGRGTFVGRFSFDPLVDGLAFRIRIDLHQNVQTVRELLEIRMILESALVERMAGTCTPEHLAELRAILERMDARAAQGEEFPEEDRAFHEALYRPLGNALIVRLLQAFWEVIMLVRDELSFEDVSPAVTASNHRRIVEALAAGDGPAAAAAMTAHFDGVQRRLRDPAAGRREPLSAPEPLRPRQRRRGKPRPRQQRERDGACDQLDSRAITS